MLLNWPSHKHPPPILQQDEVITTTAVPVSTMPLQPASTEFVVTTPPASRRCRVVRGRRYRPLRRTREEARPRTTVCAWPAGTHGTKPICPIPQTVATVHKVIPKMKTRCKHPRLRAAALSSRFCTRGMRLGSIRGGALDGDQNEDDPRRQVCNITFTKRSCKVL